MDTTGMGNIALAMREAGHSEVKAYSGTGMCYCTFYFKDKHGEFLRVGTYGADAPIVINYAIKDSIY